MQNCTRPYKAFILGKKLNGKKAIKITNYDVNHLEEDEKGMLYPCTSTRIHPNTKKIYKDFIDIPCGQCLACRLNHAKEWSDRCLLEANYHKSNYFVTLTYNNDNVPTSTYIDENGEIHYCQTLRKKDFQLFMKRLRKALKKDNKPLIKYLACGEYGSQTKRPHYHAIIFGLQLDDLCFHSRTKKGCNIFTSEFLNKIWPFGFVSIGEATKDSMGYVARYTTKKINLTDNDIYDKLNLEKEFLLSSKRPALGLRYLEDNQDKFIDYGHIYLPTVDGSISIGSNKYFNKKLDEINPDYVDIREKRRLEAIKQEEVELLNTSLNKKEYLKTCEDNLKEKVTSLSRKEI